MGWGGGRKNLKRLVALLLYGVLLSYMGKSVAKYRRGAVGTTVAEAASTEFDLPAVMVCAFLDHVDVSGGTKFVVRARLYK